MYVCHRIISGNVRFLRAIKNPLYIFVKMSPIVGVLDQNLYKLKIKPVKCSAYFIEALMNYENAFMEFLSSGDRNVFTLMESP